MRFRIKESLPCTTCSNMNKLDMLDMFICVHSFTLLCFRSAPQVGNTDSFFKLDTSTFSYMIPKVRLKSVTARIEPPSLP